MKSQRQLVARATHRDAPVTGVSVCVCVYVCLCALCGTCSLFKLRFVGGASRSAAGAMAQLFGQAGDNQSGRGRQRSRVCEREGERERG